MYKYFSLMASTGHCFFCTLIYHGKPHIKTVDKDGKIQAAMPSSIQNDSVLD